MEAGSKNAVIVLGPTASGKTRLGVRLARALGGEIVSADSRQAYRGLTLGSGKDIDEYVVDGVPVPYHLIDIVDLSHEFNVFEYQQRFYNVFETLRTRGIMPIVVGGTGLYLDAIWRGYRMVEAPENPALRAELALLSDEVLAARLRAVKTSLHNTTDTTDRDRLIRAIEIAEYAQTHVPPPAPDIRAALLGVRWPRPILRARIRDRLRARFDAGMIDEVKGLLEQGVSYQTLDFLGLEYRYIARYFRGEMRDFGCLLDQLAVAIGQFAKRQETWFRRMERNGAPIHWVDGADERLALEFLKQEGILPRAM